MGDASLRVQTKYPNAEALLHVVGATLQRGALRVPIHVAFEQPFELILASLDGDEPVSGRAEVVEHAGDATWVRFLSASPDSTEPARCVLVDTEVMSPASLTARAETFEAITAAVSTAAGDREGEGEGETTMVESTPDMRAANIEPSAMPDMAVATDDDLRIPHTGESPPVIATAAASDTAASDTPTELTMPALEAASSTPRIEPTASALGSTISQPTSDRTTVESGPIAVISDTPLVDQRPTVESPPIVASLVQMTSGDDAVAVQRGIRAITNPYAKGGLPPSNRRVVIVAASVAAVSLLVAAGSVMWAHDAVAHAEHPHVAPVASAHVVEPPPAIVEERAVQLPAATAQPTSCVLDVFSSVAESSVYLNGAANGSTPATANVECGKPVVVEIRHARYETFRRTVTPVAAREEMRATLEREKTSLHVTSEPAGASVTYNGAPIGKTPLTVKIPRYEQGTLNFSMAGMQADWRRIVPKTPEKTVTIALRKQ
jgi:hypothetical protein